MPVTNYGVLRGKVTDAIPYKSGTDHYQILVIAVKAYRIAVDVYSQFAGTAIAYSPNGNTTLDTDRMVMFYKNENYNHPILSQLLKLATGFTAKAKMPLAICLDYLKFTPPLFDIGLMKVVAPKTGTQPGQDLNDEIGSVILKAKNNPNAEVFAFGSGWDDSVPSSISDTRHYFASNPSLGVHDIHMNQGDIGSEGKANGRNQDGAFFVYFKNTNTWTAMFFRFQNQSIVTDGNGNPV